MLDVAGEQVAEIERLDAAAHQRDRLVGDTEGGVDVIGRRRDRHQIRENLGTSVGADLDDEPVLARRRAR